MGNQTLMLKETIPTIRILGILTHNKEEILMLNKLLNKADMEVVHNREGTVSRMGATVRVIVQLNIPSGSN